jgi:uncharacterized membrane protein YdfJ with MMPL/SSD domain
MLNGKTWFLEKQLSYELELADQPILVLDAVILSLSNAVVIMGSGSLLVLATDGDGYLRWYELFLCLYASWTFD